MVYHTRSKDYLPSLPNENHKGKRKATNEKVMSKTNEKKHPSDELVSSLKKKIRELEEEVSDMRGWAKLLLSVDPTLETNIDKSPVTSQATLQDNPSTHSPYFSSSTNLPHFSKSTKVHSNASKEHSLSKLPISSSTSRLCFQTSISYSKSSLTSSSISNAPTPSPLVLCAAHTISNPFKCLHIKSLPVLFTMSKPSLKNIFAKNLFNVEKKPIKIYTPLTKPINQFYEKLRLAGHIAPISEIRLNTRARWVEPSRVCAYHSGMKGHTTEECRDLKDKIQQLIDTKIICLENFAPAEPQQ
ncbi:hypothetical protein KY284_000220 [Solanum tuberosum]|nr:hypothetical protein KY284_000220 [Solanum tuberosum]